MARAAALVVVALAACEAPFDHAQGEGGKQLPVRNQPAALEPCAVSEFADPARCTTVTVRESASAGRTIALRVIVLPARVSALPDPIVPLSGGPGQGSAELAVSMAQRYEPFRDRRDIVLIDRRGTGSSNGLQCPAPASVADLMGNIFNPQHLAACRDALQARADLTQYTTALSAPDYEAAFDQLGYREVNLVGTSYGSRMGLELARRFPLRIRSLTIEGIVPMDFTWPATGAPDADAALTTLIDDCSAEPSCARVYPRFRQDVDLAFTRLRRDAVTVTVRDPATGGVVRVPFGHNDLGYATRGILYGNDSFFLPLWFRQAAEGDFTALAQAYVTRARALDAQIATGVLFGVYCAEDLPFVDGAAAERAAAGTYLGRYLLDQYRQGCAVWPSGSIDASFRTPVQSSIPTLVMTGRRDPVTPPRTAIAVSRTLPRSLLVVWPNGAHGTDGLATADCRVGIMREFLRTADPAAPSLACMSQSPVRTFAGTVP